ncbi:MAG: hypothetical protein NWE94_02850 [Candidatus Bathyarchaeota archaeon]|nr:hypothetical protein [Candidatus Bathyarchaeota archaeon]
MAKQKQHQSFDQILLEAIDEALLSLGENVRASVYFYLLELFGLEKRGIPCRLGDFSSALEKIFGLGARHLEILFLKNLHDKVKVTFKWPEYEWPLSKWIASDMTFQEYVRIVRQNFKVENQNSTGREGACE